MSFCAVSSGGEEGIRVIASTGIRDHGTAACATNGYPSQRSSGYLLGMLRKGIRERETTTQVHQHDPHSSSHELPRGGYVHNTHENHVFTVAGMGVGEEQAGDPINMADNVHATFSPVTYGEAPMMSSDAMAGLLGK